MSYINHEKTDPLLLEKICPLYNITVDDLKIITVIDNNFVYSFQKDDKVCFLRGGTRHSYEQIHAEIDWIQFLDSQGVNVSLPIQSKNGKYLEQVEYCDLLITVAVFEGAPGKQVNPNDPNEWNEALWEEMGKTLGKMHSAAVIYNSKQPKFDRIDAIERVSTTVKKVLDPKKDKKILDKFNTLVMKLSHLPKESEAFGLLQYDFHCENFNVQNGEIIVYDFDDSYYFFYLYDLAASIHEAVWDNPDDKKINFANRFVPSLWKGYSSEFQLDRKWFAYFSDFLKWREFDIYFTLVETLHDKSAPEQFLPKVEEYMIEYRGRILSDKQIIPLPDDLDIWFHRY